MNVALGSDSAGSTPLVVCDAPDVLDVVLRLCAAAGVGPEVTTQAQRVRHAWSTAPCVLVGEDTADEVAGWRLPRRGGVVLVAFGPGSEATWRRGVALRCDRVALLPDAQEWLADLLADCADGGVRRARTVGVIGASGGSGTSTVATGIALRAGQRGHAVLLVDADPLAGGIDLLLGCEDVSGVRWHELEGTQGRVNAAALREALPVVDNVAVLSGSAEHPQPLDPQTLRAMLAVGQRGANLVVVDLGRGLDVASSDVARRCDVVVVVCTPQVRSVAAARHLVARVSGLCDDLRLVLRRVPGASLADAEVADALELPLLASLPHRRGIARCVNDGLGPLTPLGSRRAFDAVLTPLLTGWGVP